jgi:NTP pyrophosphatase (non-canonical NTP hydrolase)
MSDIQKLTDLIVKLRDKRDWKKFHNAKDTSLSLVLEATEVMEHFQWKNEEEIQKYIKYHKVEIGEELSDVLYWVLLMSHDLGIDIEQAFKRKIEITHKKYPIKKAKGNHKKYTEF